MAGDRPVGGYRAEDDTAQTGMGVDDAVRVQCYREMVMAGCGLEHEHVAGGDGCRLRGRHEAEGTGDGLGPVPPQRARAAAGGHLRRVVGGGGHQPEAVERDTGIASVQPEGNADQGKGRVCDFLAVHDVGVTMPGRDSA